MNQSTYLSPHFTLQELVRSDTAARLGIDNTPPELVREQLQRTALALEAVRVRLGGAPITISSGYRSLALNRALRSKDTSQHVLGQAVDFIAPRFGSPRAVVDALKDSEVPYDQLILEFGRWVHISFKPGDAPRRQVFAIDARGPHPLDQAQQSG